MVIKDLFGKNAIIIGDDYSFVLRFPDDVTDITITAEIRKKLDKSNIDYFTVTKDLTNNKRVTFSFTDAETGAFTSYANTKQYYRIRFTTAGITSTVITGEIEIKS